MRRFAIIFLISAFVLVPPRAAGAQGIWSTVFRDDFNGAVLDTAAWSVEQTNGSYDLAGGALNFRSIPSGLPQIASRAGIIPDGFAIKLRFGFQFGNTTDYGAAIGARVSGPCAGPPTYRFHRDGANGTGVLVPAPTVCDPASFTRFETEPPAYHVGELVFSADSIVATVDGNVISSTVGSRPAPSAIWFGSVGSPCCLYTEFSVDFAEVQVFAYPVPARRATWGRLKASYR